ncbi:MAG: hypothetical protein CMJ69_07415 [Planctomycetaceae bacterium]|nr:hypothetical protein [Planctomycetaceae bacterium]
MPRYGMLFPVMAVLACAGLPGAKNVARSEDVAKKTRGGVLFYAGFDQSKDADYAAGSSKARLHGGGGTLNADGLGFRGSALRTGDGEGYVGFPAKGNISAKEGTIEFWIYAQDWDHDDGHFHRFIDVTGGGRIFFYIRPPGAGEFVVRSTSKVANRAYGCNPLKGKWSWHALTWKKGKRLGFYIGGIRPSGEAWIHDCSAESGPVPEPEDLRRILIGDFGGNAARRAHTLIDEVYIYNRALTREEVDWAAANSLTRKRGMDIPLDFMKPTARVVPDPAGSTLVVEVDSGDRSGNFVGKARLVPARGTSPAAITRTKDRFGQAVIPYTDLPQGEYKVISDITNRDGQPLASVTTRFVVPGPPVWLKEKVGVSDTPPLPWTPVEVEQDHVRVWGRDYQLGAFGLPAKIETQGASMLAGPVSFRAVVDGADVNWTPGSRRVTKKTKAEVVIAGRSRSGLGELNWRTQAEFDGFLLHDFSLTPAEGAAVELMELRIPIRREFAKLYSQGSRTRGFLPKGAGEILGAGGYWWIGTDDFGLCGATEHDGSLVDGGDGGFSIVREPTGDITVIYRFVGKRTVFTRPWKLRLILEATPTKPLPAGWRTWRDSAPFAGPSADYRRWRSDVKLWIAYPWPHKATHRHFAFPVVKDPNWFRDHVKNLHAGGPGMWRDNKRLPKKGTPGLKPKRLGNRVLPYSMFAFMAPGMPECDFYWREWYNPLGFSSLGQGLYKYAAVRPVPSYIDFMVWKHRELIREYGHDGLYVDFAGLCQPVLDVKHGLGYERGGVQRPAEFPIVANREIWKRMYTMLRKEKPESLIVGHTSENSCAPLLSFLDVWEPGEGNWFGQLRDNYLDVLPLDELRAEFRAQHFGGIPWWLPAWQRAAILEDKDVAVRREDGSVGTVSVEKTHHMLGIGLLLDIFVWPITGTNYGAVRPLYAVQDEFGMADVKFFGYWNNAKLIGGQTKKIRASVYRKPRGGSLVVVYNTTREAMSAKLTVDWDRLKSDGPLRVVDAYTKKAVSVSGRSLVLEVPRLNYRLLWIR